MHLASSVHAPTCLYDAFGRTKTPRTHTLARAHTHRNYTRTAHSCNRNLTFESEFVDSVFYTPINNSRFLFTGFYARYYSDLSFFFFLFILMIFHLRSLWKIWFFVSELFDTIEHYFEHSNSFFFAYLQTMHILNEMVVIVNSYWSSWKTQKKNMKNYVNKSHWI